MSKSRRDKRVHTPSGAERDSDSFSQPGSSFPPRIFSTNMAASASLSPQGGLEDFSNLDGCTRVPPAIDEKGVNSRITNPPSRTGVKGNSFPDHAPINLEAPEADLTLALKFLAFMKSNSGAAVSVSNPAPAALGAPPLDVSASDLTSGLLTLPETTVAPPGPWSAIRQAPSTPRVAILRGYSDQLGLDRNPRSLPPCGIPELMYLRA